MKTTIDFEKINLLPADKKTLATIRRKPGVYLDRKSVAYLLQHDLIYSEAELKDGFGAFIPTNKWHLSDTGRRYLAYKKEQRSLLFLKSLWLPIAVSLVTSSAVNTILWLLRLRG